MKIDDYRQQIDALDLELLELLNQRARLAMAIGSEKAKISAPVFVPEREKAVLDRLQELNQGPLTMAGIQEIYRTIIKNCRNLE